MFCDRVDLYFSNDFSVCYNLGRRPPALDSPMLNESLEFRFFNFCFFNYQLKMEIINFKHVLLLPKQKNVLFYSSAILIIPIISELFRCYHVLPSTRSVPCVLQE